MLIRALQMHRCYRAQTGIQCGIQCFITLSVHMLLDLAMTSCQCRVFATVSHVRIIHKFAHAVPYVWCLFVMVMHASDVFHSTPSITDSAFFKH